jgi:hypothetical protein
MSVTRSRAWRKRLVAPATIACMLACALAIVDAGASSAAVYEASPGSADAATGSCAATDGGAYACTDLRAALTRANANPGSTVRLEAGVYQLGQAHGYPTGKVAFLTISASVKIEGAGPQSTTIEQTDGRDPVIVVSFNDSGSPWQIAIEGLKLTGGVAAGHEDGEVFGDEEGGGGLRINGIGVSSSTTVTLRQDALVHNQAHAQTAHGGAIFNSGNTNSGPTLNVIETTIAENTALANGSDSGGEAEGGGIFNLGHLLIADSTISDNTVQAGGQESEAVGGGVDSGVYNLSTNNTLAIANSTITGNLASAGTTKEPPFVAGGGVAMYGGTLNHVSLYRNTTSPTNAWKAWAGNLYDEYGPGTAIRNSIIADGNASDGPNCLFPSFLPYPENEPDDLENDGGPHPECGFSVDHGSLVGISPELVPLAANGGLTETLAPMPGSPVIGASDQCEGPFGESGSSGWATAIVPLDVDQRGQPRGYPCDIGAFQTERPSATVPPSIAGTPNVGEILTCDAGSWAGEGLLTYVFEWLRNGVSSGDHTSSYQIAPNDAGNHLACLVTATGTYGSTEAASASVLVPVPRKGEGNEGPGGEKPSSEGSAGESPGKQAPGEERPAGESPHTEGPAGESPTITPTNGQSGSAQSGLPPPAAESNNGGPTPRTEVRGTKNAGTAQIAALLGDHLLPSDRAVRIPALLRHGGITLTFPVQLRGALTVDWYLGSDRQSLVATGHGVLSGNRHEIDVKLTAAGRRLLGHQGRLALVADARLLRTGAPAVKASKSLVLTR